MKPLVLVERSERLRLVVSYPTGVLHYTLVDDVAAEPLEVEGFMLDFGPIRLDFPRGAFHYGQPGLVEGAILQLNRILQSTPYTGALAVDSSRSDDCWNGALWVTVSTPTVNSPAFPVTHPHNPLFNLAGARGILLWSDDWTEDSLYRAGLAAHGYILP